MSNMTPESAGKLLIDGREFEMPTDFKISELRILERLTGTELNEINWESAGAFAAVALILLKREDPDYDEEKLDDVRLEFITTDEDKEPEEGEASPPEIQPAATGIHG